MIFQSLIIALSMYSRIPMPRIEWNEKNMKYSLVFLPLVGVITGAIVYALFTLMNLYEFGNLFMACVLSVTPLIINGGIHMDGFLDTVDALSSYGDKEKKLEILKDPHCGAFAVIAGIIYAVISVGFWSEIKSNQIVLFICAGYVISRTLSGLAVAAFPLAKNTGLAATFQNASHKKNVKLIFIVMLLAEAAGVILINPMVGAIVILVSMVVYAYYYFMSKSRFGGITGDLAGYFLQIYELVILLVMVFAGKIYYGN